MISNAATAIAAGREALGHPRGLVTLFFTEMWERLSHYGMRAQLVLFMTDQVPNGSVPFRIVRNRDVSCRGLQTVPRSPRCGPTPMGGFTALLKDTPQPRPCLRFGLNARGRRG